MVVKGAAEKPQKPNRPQKERALKCPRCGSTNTKFCYYNNYSLSQPRYFCKACRRYWTEGGSLRNVPVGGGSRKSNKIRSTIANKNSCLDPSSSKKVAVETSDSDSDFIITPLGFPSKIHHQHHDLNHHPQFAVNLPFYPPPHLPNPSFTAMDLFKNGENNVPASDSINPLLCFPPPSNNFDHIRTAGGLGFSLGDGCELSSSKNLFANVEGVKAGTTVPSNDHHRGQQESSEPNGYHSWSNSNSNWMLAGGSW